jgi:hypothetical protein
MTTLVTNLLGATRESAKRIRVEPSALLAATNVQQALDGFASSIVITEGIRVVTDGSPVAMLTSDFEIGIKQAIPGATTVNLVPAATWEGFNAEYDLVIKDLLGDALTNNITIVPNGAETIDGLAQWVIDMDLGAARLRPLADGTGWWVK